MDKGIDGWRKELHALRKKIDKIDDKLLKLLSSRSRIAIEIGRVKKKAGLAALSSKRERAILQRLAGVNGGPSHPAAIKRIFRRIVHESRRTASLSASK